MFSKARQGKASKQSKQMGQNYVSWVRLHYGSWHRGRSLPDVRPYCTRSLGPETPAGACRRPFYCAKRPKMGRGRPEGAQNALKWPKITARVPGGGVSSQWDRVILLRVGNTAEGWSVVLISTNYRMKQRPQTAGLRHPVQ